MKNTHKKRQANRLIHETSPYLLQHAHNPVNWYPWGAEALAEARKQDKPIFISIGYSTCYWCHVMETESFETDEVARALNEHFIAVKVDREERPDVDEQFMLATQLMTGRGGWPNSVWLTPDGRPWMAGTYFPKQRFIGILTQLAEAWKTRRADIERQADRMAKAIEQIGSGKNVRSDRPVDRQLVDRAVEAVTEAFDVANGGFGRAPKFPPHETLRLLVHEHRRTGEADLVKIITATLDGMAAGGVHDHLGGGFHRYSTDSYWLLPHFEKMLYDNAQLMRAYTDGFLLTKRPAYREAVEGIFAWLEREMLDPGGAYHSALDAGEVGEEGAFYVWRYDEVLAVLGEADGKRFAEAYGLKKEGNYREEAGGHNPGTNILHLPKPVEQLAADGKLEAARLRADLAAMRGKLLAVRNRREHPHKDDKVLAGWNGLMIGALAYAGRRLEEPRYTRAAARAAAFVLDKMRTEKGRLLRSYRAGKAGLPAYLDDHAFLAEGLLELHEADGNARWLEAARQLADTMLGDFQDTEAGGFYFVTAEHTDLLMRSKSILGGGNTPSANGVAALALMRLGRITGRDECTRAARRTLASMSGLMWQSPGSAETLILAAAIHLEAAKSSAAPVSAEPDVRSGEPPLTAELFASHLTVRPGQAFHVAVALDIAEGWHVYGANPDVELLIPTTVTLKPNPAFAAGKIVMPKARTVDDPVLGEPVAIHEGRIRLLVPLTAAKDAAAGPAKLQWQIRAQTCDDKRCLEARTLEPTLTVTIDPAAGAAKARHPKVFAPLGVRPAQDGPDVVGG